MASPSAAPVPPRRGHVGPRSVSAVVPVVAADLRARWPWVVLLAAVVTVVVGLSVAGVAGTRRTATVLDRFVDETGTSDVVVAALAPDVARDPEAGRDLAAALAEVRGVGQVGVVAGFPVELGVDDYFMVWSSVDDSALRTLDRPLLLEGRLPAGDPDEIAVNERAAEVLGLEVGDTVEGPTLTPEGAAAAFTGESFEGFVGPPLRLDVVGVVRQGAELSGRATNTGIGAVAAPDFARVHGATAGSYLTEVHLRAGDPSPALLRELTAVARDQVGPYELRVETVDTLWRRDAAETYRTLAGLVAVFTLTLGAAAALVVAQALNRDRFLAGRHDAALAGLGMTRRQRAGVAAAPGLLALLAGGGAGLAVGLLASAAFPLGRARDAEVAPGISVDPVVALATVAVVGGGLALWLVLSTWRATRAGVEQRPGRPSVVAERLARAGARPPMSVGVRMAFERGTGRVSLPVRSVVIGTAVAVAAATAVLVVTRTADEVAAEPARYGWVWSTVPDSLAEDPEAAAQQAAGVDGVDSVAALFFSTVLVEGEQRPAAALEPLSGGLAVDVFEGRPPVTDGEVALSPTVADDLGVGVGDRLELEGAQGSRARTLEVVGLVVPPPVDDVPRGVVLSPDGLAVTAQSEPAVYVAIRYAEGADVAAVERSLEALDYRFTPSTRPAAPSRVEQLRTIRPVLLWLVVLLAVLGAIGLLHFLGLSVRRRGHDLAVLKALGFIHGQVRRTVVVQAVAVTFVGVALGIGAGFVLGRLLWLGTVAALDIVDDPSSPVATALVAGALVVLGAAVLALGPGALAARRRTAVALRSE